MPIIQNTTEMEILITALLVGLGGSLHCVGMCGPIALSLPMQGNNLMQKFLSGLLYNVGRTVTYGIMGVFFGLIGQGFSMLGFQKWISLIMGTLMITSVLIPAIIRKIEFNAFTGIASYIRKGIQRFFVRRSYGGLFIIGVLNGLLPCGLVYIAIAGAIGTGDFYSGMFYMILFGLGTIPLMLSVSVLGNILTLPVRKKINKIIPYLVIFVGIIFVLRGLTLGIPYLSPPEKKLSPEVHSQADISAIYSFKTKGVNFY